MPEVENKNLNDLFSRLLQEEKVFLDIQETLLENAKRLSVNKEFHEDIEAWRKKWGVNSGYKDPYIHPMERPLFPESYKPALPSARVIWRQRGKHLSSEERKIMFEEMKDIAHKHSLNFEGDDFGLVTVAAFYGLMPDVVIERWDQISSTISQEMSSEVKIFIYPYINKSVEKLFLAIINYFVDKIEENGIVLEMPTSIQKLVSKARTRGYQIDSLDWDENVKPEMLLKLSPLSSKNDISRIWPHVMFQQSRLWPDFVKKPRKWRNYERDFFIWKKVKREGYTYEKAYDLWLDNNPDDKIVEISAVIKGAQEINKVYG